MLTRIEANNFKNLVDFEVDFGPFTCIAGPNGVGKSNVFDLIRFFSLLADSTIMEAAMAVRSDSPETGDLSDLFFQQGNDKTFQMEIAAEMIVPEIVTDDFGREVQSTSTYLRYEIGLMYEPPSDSADLGRITLTKESLSQYRESDARSRLRFPLKQSTFLRKLVKNRRKHKSPYISTVGESSKAEIWVHQDGKSRGQAQKSPAYNAPKTIISTSNTTATPTILAARREMQSWKMLSLEPSAMRTPDRFHSSREIDSSGGHLASTLYRLTRESAEGADREAEDYRASISSRLSELVDIRDVRVNIDQTRQLITLEIEENTGRIVPARSISDGTLRFLVLCILAEDPLATGVLCMEEPENGIHPEKIEAMSELLHDIAVDPEEKIDTDNPLRQVIVATHSPAFVQWQEAGDLLFANKSVRKDSAGQIRSILRLEPISGTWRVSRNEGVGKGHIFAYLNTSQNRNLQLFLEQ